jgi:hypothetical protein
MSARSSHTSTSRKRWLRRGDGTPCDSDRLFREVPGFRYFDWDGRTEASASYGLLGSSCAIVTVLVAEADAAMGNPRREGVSLPFRRASTTYRERLVPLRGRR